MNILYATDGSAGALAPAELIAQLELTSADRIRLISVNSSGSDTQAGELFAPLQQRLAGSAATIDTSTRTGTPVDQILAAAAELPADLIVVGATGLTGLQRFFVGSVAERVLRHAPISVLMGRPVRHNLARVLVAVDSSKTSRHVSETAARLPLPARTELRLITVIPPREAVMAVAPMVWEAISGELDRAMQACEVDARERLKELAALLRQGQHPVSAEIGRGDPAHMILSTVQKDNADLIVMGSHGEGGVDRFLLGSVSERVARHAVSSVLVVR